jgi:hypothetical protein
MRLYFGALIDSVSIMVGDGTAGIAPASAATDYGYCPSPFTAEEGWGIRKSAIRDPVQPVSASWGRGV